MATHIHPTAIIDPAAHIGDNVTIGPFTIVEDDVEIGDDTIIGPHAQIACGTRLGTACRVFKGAAVGNIPQDLKFVGEKTYLHIGDRTTVREFCTLNRGTAASGQTVIGNDCLIMAYGHVAHDCHIGNRVIMGNNLAMAGHVIVEDFVTISGFCGIHQFVRIGQHSYVGAMVKLAQDLVPFALVADSPVRIVGINKVGLERKGFDTDRRQTIQRAFRTLFRKQLSLTQALEALQVEFPENLDVQSIIDFVKKSERGFLRMEKSED